MNKIRILIVENDSDWLKELIKLLNSDKDILVVGTAVTKEEAVQFAQTIQFDIALMDINLSENNLDGIYAAFKIGKICKSKIIMLASLNDEEIIEKAFTAGAVNFITKEKYMQIPHVIREVYRTVTPIEILVRKYRNLKKEEQLKCLTPAEKAVFELVEQGYTRSQIEKKLLKTESTVKNQIKNIIKKIGGSNLKKSIEIVEMRGMFSSSNKSNT
ncbi:response regulator transcription factor [Caldalkalibacillus mannanilyticus]|uniref:response regulator transcription factor n=1 Tax=Caldalkalibacillus mannanilyticus TaxID=1418 RepID=UPI0004687FD8|nr:response regulator transcription factor [Caldalkalibacillus mannanilyticus]